MYLLSAFPSLIPILMLAPLLIAVHIDKEKMDGPIASNIFQIVRGFFIGSLIYLGMFIIQILLGIDFNAWDWGLIQISGIILPILFGGLFLYMKGRGQIRLFGFTRGGIGASALYLLITVIPFLLPWFLLIVNLRIAFTVLVFPVLFGLWLLLSMSNYTRKFYLAYTLLSLLSSLFYLFVLFGFSAM